MRSVFLSVAVLCAAGLPAAGQSLSDVRTGVLDVRQLDAGNEDTSVAIDVANGSLLFSLVDRNRGDYTVGFGTGLDLRGGVMIPAVRDRSRTNTNAGNTGGNPGGDRVATVSSSRPSSRTALFVSAHGAPSGSEMNVDVAAAFFPFASGFVAGHAVNEANNGPMTRLFATDGLGLGGAFVDEPGTAGVYRLDLRSFGADGGNGVLIAAGGKNEDNYALTRNLGDGRYEVFCKDNGSNGAGLENDPVVFVYLPYAIDGLVAGRIAEMDGAAPGVLSGSGGFTVSAAGPGVVLLRIAGVTDPASGVLLVSPEGGEDRNADNVIVADWSAPLGAFVVESLDIPGMSPQGLAGEPMFSFAWVPVTAGPDGARRPNTSTIVALPDTQLYAQDYPAIFHDQLAWIADEAGARDIGMVLHLGDITNRNTAPEWQVARAAYDRIDAAAPYILATGNHDHGLDGNAGDRSTRMNAFFLYDTVSRQRTFGGAMVPGRLENTYSLFESGGRRWIAVALEWGPRDEVLTWADGVLTRHADRLAIVTTHAYMYRDDTRMDQTVRSYGGSPYNYATAGLPGGTNDGGDLWRGLIRRHANVVMVLSGHITGEGYLASPTGLGNTVHQMLADYQGRVEGGEGFLRLFEVVPDSNVVWVRTCSPWVDRSFTSPGSFFAFDLDGPASRSALIDDVDVATPIGSVDFFDLLTLLERFDAGDSIADRVAPFGVVDRADLESLLVAFAARSAP